MKIGILTFHASHNYGSMLQAYALQHYLNMSGHDAETINLRIEAQRDVYHHPLVPVIGKGKLYMKSLFSPFWLYHECRKWNKYEDFLQQNLRLTKRTYKSWEEIVTDLPNLGYECMITGGDQIWNMRCRDFDKSYFLPQKIDGIKKVAYSPSFGNFLKKMTTQEEVFLKDALSDYSSISVREGSMQEYLEESLKRKVFTVVDPTLLLSVSDYGRFIKTEPLVKGDYIYYYSPSIIEKSERLAKKMAQHYGMPVVTSFPHLYSNSGFKTVYESGPAEFLNLVQNASLVVGKSFHLVAFSLLFHKNFIAIGGEADARMNHILTTLGIPERGMVNEENYRSIVLPPINFAAIDEHLNKMQLDSYAFLQDALTDRNDCKDF